MITVRKSEDRGKTHIDWLDSRHSFSFGEYYDPANESFGALRVINEDWIKGGAGFQPHSHRDMEIVTYILEGAISHKDSSGGGVTPGYEQKTIAPDSVRNHFARIAAPDPRTSEVRLVQDAEIWAARLEA